MEFVYFTLAYLAVWLLVSRLLDELFVRSCVKEWTQQGGEVTMHRTILETHARAIWPDGERSSVTANTLGIRLIERFGQ